MPKVRMPDGSLVDVTTEDLFDDTGQNPFIVPTPSPTEQTFTAADVERIRGEERDKLYGRLDTLSQTVDDLQTRLEPLTAAEQARLEAAQAEEQRLAEEARIVQQAELTPQQLVEQNRQEWQAAQAALTSELETERSLRAKEKEFNDLREYAQAQVTAHTEGENADIAPQFVPWITGNSQAEIDAAIARAVESTNSIMEEIAQITQTVQVGPDGQPIPQPDPNAQIVIPGQQPTVQAPPTFGGSRAWAGPPVDVAGDQSQTLTAEQISNMPMDEYAKLRGRLGVAPRGQNHGLFG